MAKKHAVLVATAIEVQCPYCGAAQLAPDGSGEIWAPSQLTQNTGSRACVSCAEHFIVANKSIKVRQQPPTPANLCGGYTMSAVMLANVPPRMRFAYESSNMISATLDRSVKCEFISHITAWEEPPIRVIARLLFCAPFALEYWKTHA